MESCKGIKYPDPELEESFSFSSSSGCFDFNSSASLPPFFFSDDDDDDEESYIEIALQPAHVRHHDQNHGDDEMELRISLSSSGVPQTNKTTTLESSSCTSSFSSSSSSAFTFNSSHTEVESGNQQLQTACDNRILEKSNFKRKEQFPTVNRFVNTLISSFRLKEQVAGSRSPDATHLQLAVPCSTSRRTSMATTTTTTVNDGMMKFFIKFRVMKLKTQLASFLKASQPNSSLDNRRLREETLWTYNHQNLTNPIMEKGSPIKQKGGRATVLEFNLDAIRGVLESMSSIWSFGRRERSRTKRCSDSNKSSPIHQRYQSETYKVSSINDNSIQAAIAHCKRSHDPNV